MTVHPLQEVREERAVEKENRDLGGLIRTAIMDQLKTSGTCTADDLIPLYPVGQERRCRSLATAYFGCLSSAPEGKEALICEKGRVKSIVPERKGAKNTIWGLTKAGRIHCGITGHGTEGEGQPSSSGPLSAVSGDSSSTGVSDPVTTEEAPHALSCASAGVPEPLSLFDQAAA